MKRRRDAGSRTFVDVFRHPVAAFSAPWREGHDATEADRRAVAGPEGRLVGCWLRVGRYLRDYFDLLPYKFKFGWLLLDQGGARWAPGVRWREARAMALPEMRVRVVRDPSYSDLSRAGNNKKDFLQVIEVDTSQGELLLMVSKDSVALVVERLTADS